MVPLERGRLHEFSGKISQKEGNPTSTHFSTQIHKLQGPGFRNMAIFLYNPTNPNQPNQPQPTPNQPPTNPAQLVAVLSSEVIHFFEQGIATSG